MFTLAHLSDIHLGPVPGGAAWRNFRMKRVVGCLSWRFRRRKLHDAGVAALIAEDILRAAPDHVAVTGDIVNVAAEDEFPRAARFLERLGGPADLSFVPGNHDVYVKTDWGRCLAHLAPWMEGDMRVKRTVTTAEIAEPFPYVRLRKNVALLGLSTARPQALHRAGGTLGAEQVASAGEVLRDLRERGYARVVLIHHPPLPGQAIPRKALTDAAELSDMLVREGAELVLHGHNHMNMHEALATRFGACHVIGVASASMATDAHADLATWNNFRIARQAGRWAITMRRHSYVPASRLFQAGPEVPLST